MPRKLWEIAQEIAQDVKVGKCQTLTFALPWIHSQAGVYARPYWSAMNDLETVDDTYGADSAKSIVLYFLANAGTWRGETARRIKQELRGMVK